MAWGCVHCTAAKIVLLELSSVEVRKAIEWQETASGQAAFVTLFCHPTMVLGAAAVLVVPRIGVV